MTAEAFCPQHGPYDPALGACPYCSGSSPRPAAPVPLSEDDMVTDLGAGSGGIGPNPQPGFSEGEEPTEIPSHRAGGGFLDLEDEDLTQPGVHGRRDDVTELEIAPKITQGLLWVKEGNRRGRYYPIKNGTIIGRKEDSDLILDDPKVSGTHARFKLEGDQFEIWDFGSANGTYVNGKKIREATMLEENDLIKIGETKFILKLLDPKPKRRSTPPTKKSPPAKKTPK